MKYDLALALDMGRRPYQEDSIAADFAHGPAFGFAVLADGMGGHAAGDIASKLVMTEVFSNLKLQADNPAELEADIANVLIAAANAANTCIHTHVSKNPDCAGMGATLLATVIFENRLYWISVGDSPLFLYRKGKLEQLNEDHSLAPQIDFMVKTGQIDEATARNHPDRNSLRSVVMGRNIPMTDCSGKAALLQPGDIVIAASDGLQFLTNAQIETVLKSNRKKPSVDIAEALMAALEKLDDPDQDNISIAVLRLI